MDAKTKLIDILSDFFGIGSPDGSYTYQLGRSKDAFATHTMGFDDFTEYGEDEVIEIATYLIEYGVRIPVKCKNCKSGDKSGECVYCLKHGCIMDDDSFCSDGEIRNDESE